MAFVLQVQSGTRPKSGHTVEQNEDAIATDDRTRRVAIADGASEGWGSGAWAKTLSAAFVRCPPTPDDFPAWLTAVRQLAPVPPAAGSWYAVEKQALGAFSTLVGVSFDDTADGGIKWRAVAVGDSCLFHYRRGKRLVAFPLEPHHDFSNRPNLVGSLNDVPAETVQWYAGRAIVGDDFYLTTDAAAAWLLTTGRSTELNSALVGGPEFETWVTAERSARRLANDDTTILKVTLAHQETTG